MTHLKKPVVTKFRASSSECYAIGELAYDALALTILWRMEARWSDRKAEVKVMSTGYESHMSM